MRKLVVIFFCLMGSMIASAAKGNVRVIPMDTIHDTITLDKAEISAIRNLMVSDPAKADFQDTVKFRKKHRAIAALLAFPVLGVFGLHRIYMHTAPAVPFIYIVTAGGLFGVLPFIDFVLILLNKDIHLTYTSNPHLFMWQKR
jgi:TM2 domain-containing membrane protein YozV